MTLCFLAHISWIHARKDHLQGRIHYVPVKVVDVMDSSYYALCAWLLSQCSEQECRWTVSHTLPGKMLCESCCWQPLYSRVWALLEFSPHCLSLFTVPLSQTVPKAWVGHAMTLVAWEPWQSLLFSCAEHGHSLINIKDRMLIVSILAAPKVSAWLDVLRALYRHTKCIFSLLNKGCDCASPNSATQLNIF